MNVDISGLSKDNNGNQILVTQGLTGCKLVAGKQCLIRLYLPSSTLGNIKGVLFKATPPPKTGGEIKPPPQPPTCTAFHEEGLIFAPAQPLGPSVGFVVRGFAFPRSGTYTVTLSARDANNNELASSTLSLRFYPVKDFRLLIVPGIHDGVINNGINWDADVYRAMMRLGNMLPVRDGVGIGIDPNDTAPDGNKYNGLRVQIGKPWLAWGTAYSQQLGTLSGDQDLVSQIKAINDGPGDHADLTASYRQTLGTEPEGGNSGGWSNGYHGSHVTSFGPQLPGVFGQEIGHNFGLEAPGTPNYDDGSNGDQGHSTIGTINDPLAFDFLKRQPFQTIGDTMNNFKGGAFQGEDAEAYSSIDWNILSGNAASLGLDPQKFDAQQYPGLAGPSWGGNDTGTDINTCMPPTVWQERGAMSYVVALTQDGTPWAGARFPVGAWERAVDISDDAGNPAPLLDVALGGSAYLAALTAATVLFAGRREDGSWDMYLDLQTSSAGKLNAANGLKAIGGGMRADSPNFIVVDGAGALWHTERSPGYWGTAQNWTGWVDVRAAGNAQARHFVDVGVDGTADGTMLYAVAVADDGSLHWASRANGKWDAFALVPGAPGGIKRVDCAVVGNDLQVMVATNNGGLLHSIAVGGTQWQQSFGDVKGQVANIGKVVDVACAGVGKLGTNGPEMHASVVTSDGGLWQTRRHTDRTWTQLEDVRASSRYTLTKQFGPTWAPVIAATAGGAYSWHLLFEGSSWNSPRWAPSQTNY